MSAGGIMAEVNQGDIDRLMATMWKAERTLNKSVGESIRWTAWALAKTLGTSTKVSKKSRPVKRDATAKVRGKKQAFSVKSYRGGTIKERRIYAESLRAAKASRAATIGRRGQAKAAWSWGIRALGSGGSMPSGMKSGTARIAGNNMHVTKHLTGNDKHILIENKLRYAGAAFKTQGDQSVNTAAARAGRMMEKQIRAKIYGSKLVQ